MNFGVWLREDVGLGRLGFWVPGYLGNGFRGAGSSRQGTPWRDCDFSRLSQDAISVS